MKFSTNIYKPKPINKTPALSFKYFSQPSCEIQCPAKTPIPEAKTKADADAKKITHFETGSVAENPIVANWVLSPNSAINTARKIFKNISIFPQDKES